MMYGQNKSAIAALFSGSKGRCRSGDPFYNVSMYPNRTLSEIRLGKARKYYMAISVMLFVLCPLFVFCHKMYSAIKDIFFSHLYFLINVLCSINEVSIDLHVLPLMSEDT